MIFFSCWYVVAPPLERLPEGRRREGSQHELLEVDGVVGVGAPVDHVQERHRQNVRVGPPQVAEESYPQLVGSGVAAASETPRMALAPSLDLSSVPSRSLRGPVEDPLIEGVQAEDRGRDLIVDRGHGLGHALAPIARPAVPQLQRLAGPRGCPGRDGRPPGCAGIEAHLDLDRGIAPGVQDLATAHEDDLAQPLTPLT